MNDIIVHFIDMPPTVKGQVRPTADGDYLVFINSLYNEEQQKEIYNHEVRHLLYGHHYIEGCPIGMIERQADQREAMLDRIRQAEQAGLPLETALLRDDIPLEEIASENYLKAAEDILQELDAEIEVLRNKLPGKEDDTHHW